MRAYPGIHERVPKSNGDGSYGPARATNAARDAEVQIEWFNERSARFTAAQRRQALAPFRARLRARRRAGSRMRSRNSRAVGKLERKLRRRLTASQSNAGLDEAPFRAVAAQPWVQKAAGSTRASRVTQSTNADEVHATRIAAKRVRYLLESLEPGLPDGALLVGRPTSLQDLVAP